MDPPQKKRGFFSGFSLWGRSEVPTDPERRAEFYRTVEPGDTPPIPRVGFNASPESPAKRASDAQLSTRKIIDRPQGPSSKLSQSITATDLARLSGAPKSTNFSATTSSNPNMTRTLTRMPGDNPNKISAGSSSTNNNTLTSFSLNNRRVANLSGSATTPRNMFRSTALNQRPSFAFSPTRPHNTMKESFPPTTPGRAPRGSTAELNGRGLTHTSSSELFAMRIPSPPHDLTGERLAKEVPQDHNRAGSIYADEFLTDYCPPDFDDLQRRQFFCILDLRRLKYAADEVFAKKDWKLSILNFAKEYEKSRSLIMLRYGLYEFKTVKVSDTVRKQWQKEHGIPSSDDEKDASPSGRPNGTHNILGQGRGKRKATEDLNPRDNSLAKSSTNLNKRRATEREPLAEATPIATNKSKRKADILSDPDEDQPSKLQKPSTTSQPGSAVKSIFEKIANGGRNETAASTSTPSKFTRSASATKPVNGGLGRSVLDPGSKPSMTNNIFGHLSDASKGSGNDDADAESESTESEAEGDEESEAQEASQSNEASVAASGGTSTPQFGAGAGGLFAKKAMEAAPSSASSEAGDNGTKGRSLFDRLTFGNDGQPVRILPPQAEKQVETSPEPLQSQSPVRQSPVRDTSSAPANNTWNTDTPIKFAPGPAPSASILGSASKNPAPLFAPKEPTPSTPAAEPEAPAATAAAAPKPAEEPAKPAAASAPASSSATPQLFPAKSPFSTSGAPAFGAVKSQAAGTNASPFGSSATAFGQPKPASEQNDTAAAAAPASSASSLFGATPKPSESTTPKPPAIFQSSTLFGSSTPATEAKAAPASQPKPLFGAPAAKSPEPAASETPTPSIFASASTPKPSGSIFGSSAAAPSTTTEAPKPLFGTSAAPSSAASTTEAPKPLFGATTAPSSTTSTAEAPKSLFGATTAPSSATSTAEAPKPLFGATTNQSTPSMFGAKPSPAPETKNIFGAVSAAPTPKPLFGGTPASQEEPAKPQASIFANPAGTSTPAAASTPFSFGGSRDTTPVPQFGAGASKPDAAQPGTSSFGNGGASTSFNFTAGGGEQSAFNNPFATNGATSAPPSFNFGGNSADTGSQASKSQFVFGGGSQSFGGAGSTPSISFGGGSGAGTPAAQPSVSFGSATNGSGSGASPFTFGGASSQASAAPPIFSQPPAAAPLFGSLAPPVGGTSTGTSKFPPLETDL